MAGFILRLFTLLMACFFLPSVAYAKTQKVLVLHSYHQGLEWTDNISSGIKSVFDSENDIEVYYHYLDTKRNAGPAYTKKLIELFRLKRDQNNFDLIITSDNNALNFIHDYGHEFYPDTPVIFCGVNFFSEHLIEGMALVTGITESADVRSTLELMLQVHPKTEKVLFVLDQTTTGLAIRNSVEEALSSVEGRVETEFYTDFSLREIEQEIASYGSEYLIYLLTMNRDRDGAFISYKDGIELISRSAHVPLYGSWDFYLGKGIVGGVITSGFTQGELAAKYALRVLNGESVSELPIVYSAPNQAIFDYNQMHRFGIEPRQLPDDAEIINRPQTLWEQIQIIPAWLFVSFISVVLLLLLILVNQRRNQALFVDYNQVLDRKVKQKTEALNLSNQKLTQFISMLPSPVFYLDSSNVYLACNDAFAHTVFGLAKVQVEGHSLNDLSSYLPSLVVDAHLAKSQELMRYPGTRTHQSPLLCADGYIRDFMFHSIRIHDLDGSPQGFIAVMSDISTQCSMQREKEKLICELERVNHRLNIMAITDALTGVYNRGHISKRLTEEIHKADRYKTPLAVVMLDVDRFKTVNDRWGHQTGDLVLQKIIETVQQTIRDSDIVGRYGGEEFLLILPHTDIEDAYSLAERIRCSIEAMSWDFSDTSITISGGVASFDGSPQQQLLNRADICLYMAKSSGRNRVIVHTEVQGEIITD